MTPFDRLIAEEISKLLSPDAAILTQIQNDAMKRLERAEKKARAAKGAPPSVQALAKENLEFAVAHAEEWFALELEEL